MKEVPPVTLAAWRLQITTVFLTPGFYYQWRNLTNDEKEEFKKR